MTEERAVLVLQLDKVEEWNTEHVWADCLARQFLARMLQLEIIKSRIQVALDIGKKYKIPKKQGQYYTMDLVSKECCEIHEAFQFLRRKFVGLFGEPVLSLSEEELETFNTWMDGWLEQKQLELFINMKATEKRQAWRF